MNPTIKNTNNMTEMLFENRNKNYGAYVIRTTYNDALLKSLLIISALLLLVVGSTSAYNNFFAEKPAEQEAGIDVDQKIIEVDLNPIDEQKPTPQPKSRFTPPTQAMATIISNDSITEPDPNVQIGSVTSVGTKGDTTDVIVPNPGGDPRGTDIITVKAPVDEPAIIVADVMPEFPGGNSALMNFLSGNIVYPDKAVALGIEGTVYVNFVVNKEGKVDNIKILKGIGGDCNEEAMRVVAKMPKWKPGKNAGKEVKVMFNLPIKFRLQ